ncbi:uncharacterized protein LOC101741103 [Bombyx mori]|uniref:Uncharacterized protein n=1 Tax=Bombyx mori TaxID=7091 RepID=A0A8R2R6I9_BOMMO|nr:uncharacterized protein LOC101741103 [Bombyx mori]
MKFITFFILIFCLNERVSSAGLVERSYEYMMSVGKSIAPSLMTFMDCVGEDEFWGCARERLNTLLDGWNAQVQEQRRKWKEEADAEVRSSGRSLQEMPSQIGEEVEESLNSLTKFLHGSMARSLEGKKHESGGIDSITISTGGEKKKMKKKKPKPPKIHLLHPIMMKKQEKGREARVQSWVIGERNLDTTDDFDLTQSDPTSPQTDPVQSHPNLPQIENLTETDSFEMADGSFRQGRGVIADIWSMGADAIDSVAEHAIQDEDLENGVTDKSSPPEQRGKKKKKKKAILKLLILGAVLKAKIGTLLQILSFKLQVKFFIIALIGLAINLARLWIDIKNKHNQQPQKVIYYEHAQHQHHYEHEDEHEHGWGPWSRTYPEESDVEIDVDNNNSPYRAQEKSAFSSLFPKL